MTIENGMVRLRKAICVGAVVAFGSVQAATVTVDTVAKLVEALKAGTTDIVLKAGVTFDVSSLTPESPKDWWEDASDTKIAYLICKTSGTLRGENTTHWSIKTPEQESVIKCNHATERLLYAYGSGRNGKYQHITFDGGNAVTDAGGGLYFLGPSTGYATNCVFRNCSGTYAGGTFCVTAYDCFYTNCTATSTLNGGGGAYGEGKAAYKAPTNSFVNCTFVNCASSAAGGAIYMRDWSCGGQPSAGRIDGCVFSNCTAATSGGAVHAQLSAGLVRNCRFTDNQAAKGGALFVGVENAGQSVVSNCTFVGNKSTGSDARDGGGAVFGWKTVSDCRFTGNSAEVQGGAVYGSTVDNNSRFVNNVCVSGGGGGCCNCRPVRNSFFTGNNVTGAGRGGAIKDCTAESCVFSNNYCGASVSGAAAASSDCFDCRFGGYGDVSVGSYTRCVFDGVIQTNSQTWVLNSMHWKGGSIGVTNCLITHCKVSGLVDARGDDADVVNCTFADNTFPDQYGVVIRCMGGADYNEKTPEGTYKTYPASCTYVNCLFSGNMRPNGESADLRVAFTQTTDHGENHLALSDCFYTAGCTIPSGVVTNAILCGNAKFNAGKFEDAPYYTLLHSSKARNAGQAMPWMNSATDLAGNPRLLDAKPDIGCYESDLPGFGMMLLFR